MATNTQRMIHKLHTDDIHENILCAHTHLVHPAASRVPNSSSIPPQTAAARVTPFSSPTESDDTALSDAPTTVASM